MKKQAGIIFTLIFLLLPVHILIGVPEELKESLSTMFSTFQADFSYTNTEGNLFTGKLYYQYPDKMHLRLSDNRVIATNGTYLWMYSPSTMVCARQKVEQKDQYNLKFLTDNFTMERNGDHFVFTRPDGKIKEIVLDVQNQMIKNIRLKVDENFMNISFSNVERQVGLKASLFNYKPPTDAQLVENPLNKVDERLR
jgi:outer membrane lipoprotein-sorting protein